MCVSKEKVNKSIINVIMLKNSHNDQGRMQKIMGGGLDFFFTLRRVWFEGIKDL